MAETAGMRWYVMRAISGKEGKVKEYVDAQVAQGDYGDKVSQVLIPKEKYVDVRNGKRIVKERCHLPGYVLVECILAGEVQGMLRNTPNVLGFLGETKATDNSIYASSKPYLPLTQAMDHAQSTYLTGIRSFFSVWIIRSGSIY